MNILAPAPQNRKGQALAAPPPRVPLDEIAWVSLVAIGEVHHLQSKIFEAFMITSEGRLIQYNTRADVSVPGPWKVRSS